MAAVPTPTTHDDRGDADPELVRALALAAAAPQDLDAQSTALGAVARARLLIPVMPLPEDAEQAEPDEGCLAAADLPGHPAMGAAVITGAAGDRALLAFTGMAALEAWNPASRPMPHSAKEAAEAAFAHGADALVIDVADPHRYVLTGRPLGAIAHGWQIMRIDGPTGVGEWVWAAVTEESTAS